jgi:hypothetical protein
MYSSTLSLTSALDSGGWPRPRPAALHPGKDSWYPLCRRLGGPQGLSGRVRKTSPPLGFDPRTVQSSAGRCTDYAVDKYGGLHWHLWTIVQTTDIYRTSLNLWAASEFTRFKGYHSDLYMPRRNRKHKRTLMCPGVWLTDLTTFWLAQDDSCTDVMNHDGVAVENLTIRHLKIEVSQWE